MVRLRLAYIAAPLAAACLLVSGSSEAFAVARPGASAAPVVANDDATFSGNSCTSVNSCVAVGFYDIPSEQIAPALVENYTGGSWRPDVPIPQYGGYATIANEVSCGAPGICMLVGDHYTRPSRPGMLAELSSGTSWTLLRWSNPPGARWGFLGAVSCVGSSYCMLAGTVDRRTQQNYSTQWQGSGGLKQINTPNPPHARWAEIAGVSCSSATDCVAVGNYENAVRHVLTFSLQWNGAKWRFLPGTPNVRHQAQSLFNDISCASATKCVAVGWSVSPGRHSVTHPFAATWTAGKWRLSAAPGRTGSALSGVSCPAVSYCVAVGYYGRLGLAERWNGSSWRILSVVRTRGAISADGLAHVSCVSTSHCVAVGYRYNPKRNYSDNTLAEVWNGRTWKVQATANP
jgi:hypothetical protein